MTVKHPVKHPRGHAAAAHKATPKKHKAHPKGSTKKHAPPKHKHKHLSNAQLAVQEIYPKEKSPYRALPKSRRGPGKLTGGYYITISCSTIALQLTTMLGPGGAHITGGYANWDQIAVPRGAPISIWNGRGLYTMDLDLMLDHWGSHKGHPGMRKSIEDEVIKLEKMAQRLPASLTPPTLRLYGPVPHPKLRWVITGIDWGDPIRRHNGGHRLRQPCTVHLAEFRDETVLQNLKPAAAKPKHPRKYKIKTTDKSLKTIAAKLLGKAASWHEIVKLNPHFKPKLRGFKITKPMHGKTLLVPPAPTKHKGKAHHHKGGTKGANITGRHKTTK